MDVSFTIQCRKLKNDLKTTNVDELHIQMETYYEETRRLQQVLSSVYSQGPGTRNIPDARYLKSKKRNTVYVVHVSLFVLW